MDSPELRKLAAATQRHADADGEFHTAVPRLTLYRSSAPTEHNAVVYVPSLCVIVQGAKEVVVGSEAYRYDPAHALLVAVAKGLRPQRGEPRRMMDDEASRISSCS